MDDTQENRWRIKGNCENCGGWYDIEQDLEECGEIDITCPYCNLPSWNWSTYKNAKEIAQCSPIVFIEGRK